LGGTLAGPDAGLARTPGGAVRLPGPFWAAAAIAVALHAAVLAIRPGGLTGNYVAPPSTVMAVRVVPRLVSAEPATAAAQSTAAPALPSTTQTTAATSNYRHEAQAKIPRSRVFVGPSVTGAGVPVSRGEPGPSNPTTAAAPQPSSAEAALPAAPDYAFGVRLDPGPRPLDEIEPDYPDTIRLREGSVVLRLLISDTGHVDNVAVVRAEPRGVFEQAALDAFSKARFSPGFAAGTPVKSQITVEVQFAPTNRGARV